MIRYPFLKEETTIGVTAPSSGVKPEMHELLKDAIKSMEKKGYKVVCGETPWNQIKATSAPARVRADEFNKMMEDDSIGLIIPPWGGELLMEIFEYLDFDKIKQKWVMGYSDTSLLLLAITLKTGIATAHGTNLIDLRGEYSDATTEKWQEVLTTKVNGSVLQHSSPMYQREWDFENPSPHIFHLNEKTCWKSTQGRKVEMKGRLLGGCVDTIRHIIGTTYGDVQGFLEAHIKGDSIIWFLENCDLSTTDLRRTLVQMKLAGWFDDCKGIMFGRSSANETVDDYTAEDIYNQLSKELNIPIVYDIDCGHVPPQITFINGAYAQVEVENGRGSVLQEFI
ncbi:MAG: LD-carboxypeptidase [Gudongella sp.]|nr:LD-carboxypeptidase [Gudongella sp.]